MDQPFGDRIYVRPTEVVAALGISHSTLRRMILRGQFPKPYRPNRRLILFKVDEVLAALSTWNQGVDGDAQK